MAEITYTDKVVGSQFTAADANEIKSSVNDIYEMLPGGVVNFINNQDEIVQIADFNISGTGKTGDQNISNLPETSGTFYDVLTRNPYSGNTEVKSIAPEGARFNYALSAIYAWGDSLTAGSGGTPYPTQLNTITNFTITNKGVGGETSTQIKDRLVADSANYSKSVIIWAGRNNYFDATTVKADIATMIATLGHDRYLVLSILNGDYNPYEYEGGAGHGQIVNLNNDLEALYGEKYIDVRKLLVNAYNPALPQDVIDFGNDIPPTSLRSDQIHLNTAGYLKVAEFINQRLGWLYNYNGYLQSKDVDYYTIRNQSASLQSAAYRISGTGDAKGFLANGSFTASAGSAVANSFTNTLTATANGNTLVGLDINPTFTIGAFTGVNRYGLRVVGGINLSTDGYSIDFANNGNNGRINSTSGIMAITCAAGSIGNDNLRVGSTADRAVNISGGIIRFSQFNFGTVNGQIFGNTGNFILQNGGTFTDDGVNRLQVTGSIKATQHNITALNTAPATATSTGTLGEVRWTATHVYLCTATNVWVRAALATF